MTLNIGISLFIGIFDMGLCYVNYRTYLRSKNKFAIILAVALGIFGFACFMDGLVGLLVLQMNG